MKIELPKHRRLQPGPASNVVMATCVGRSGRPNIITLGMYMPISIDPPLVCIGVAPRRYSHALIEETGEFVVNTPSIDLEEQMHYCGVRSGRDVDKWAETGLTPTPALKVKPPLIEECFSHLECRVVQSHICGDHTLFLGEVVATSANAEFMDGDVLDVLKARPIVQKNHVYYSVCEK
ncbi:MAG: flavin reductase family protein [Candidatus Bathyarchaeota archaeon]|nr:MAG: flavin reductase family protein [Candidatus Bathyarchaeota archaeon]